MKDSTSCGFGPCGRKPHAKGLCSGHYQQARSGQPLKPLRGQAARHGDVPRNMEGRAILPCVGCRETKTIEGLGRCGACYQSHRKAGLGPCSADGCTNRSRSRGLCTSHYEAARSGRDLDRFPLSPRNKFGYGFGKVLKSGDLEAVISYVSDAAGGVDGNGCLNWPGGMHSTGYGRFSTTGNNPDLAHRLVAELAFGNIDGLPIHHKCANRRCVAPGHLAPVTAVENNAEMMARNYYERRIELLESALRNLVPSHNLLPPIDAAEHADRASLDHIVPQSHGGSHDPSNLRMAHVGCNARRGDRVDALEGVS